MEYVIFHKNESKLINSKEVLFADGKSARGHLPQNRNNLLYAILFLILKPGLLGAAWLNWYVHGISSNNWQQHEHGFFSKLIESSQMPYKLFPYALASGTFILQATTFKFDLKFNKI